MIVFPKPMQGPIRLPTAYSDGKYRVNFELVKSEDGTISIERNKFGDFTPSASGVVIPASGKSITIYHTEKGMKWHNYQFEAPDHHFIGALAKEILDRGDMDEATAKKLSSRMDMEIDACKEKRIGHIVSHDSEWGDKIMYNRSNQSAAKGRS